MGSQILESLAKLQVGRAQAPTIASTFLYPNVFAHDNSKVHLGDVYHVHPPQEPEGVPTYGLCWGAAPLIDPDLFIGRALELDQMTQVLRPGEAMVEQRRVVLGGLGGMGKTQLAIAYARRHQSHYTSVFWINATSVSTLKASVRWIAQNLLPAAELQNPDDDSILRAVLQWLSDIKNTQWLLIFDNYDDPDLYGIEQYLPNAAHGSIIVTTRLSDLIKGQRMRQVRVPPIDDLEESLEILQTRSQRYNIRHDPDACRLVERLAGLPLALATAGTYLLKTTLTFGQYLDAYEQRFNVNPRRPTQLQEYQDRTLYTTWDLSYSRLEQENELAARTLRLLAYFDNQQIWYELLHAGLDNDSHAWLQEVAADRIDFENVMSTLVDYCLVEVDPATRSYSIHNCVHDWTLTQLNKMVRPDQYWYAAACVVASVGDDDWAMLGQLRYARLARHAFRLVHGQILQNGNLNPIFSNHLDQLHLLARLLSQQAHFLAAEKMYLRALAGKENTLGCDHSSTLTTINNLGILYKNQGKLVEAEQMFLRALAGREKVLGSDHSLTLTTLNNLGILYKNQGKLDIAERTLLRALAGKQNTLGLDHTKTLQTVNNLGRLYIDQGKLTQAEQTLRLALAGREKSLGLDHTQTLDTVNNLGVLYSNQRKLDWAEKMLERALVGRENAMGPDHSSTLATVNSLGSLYRDQGKLDEAELMCTRAVVGYTEWLGHEHQRTLHAHSLLDSICQEKAKMDSAKQPLPSCLLID